MVCQCRFLFGKKKCTTLVNNFDNREDHVHTGIKGVWEISVPAFNFARNLKLI